MVSITHAAVVLALINSMFFHKSLCVKIAPDLPPAERPWSATGNSDTVLELPFNFVERRADGITLTTVKTAPGCSPEQVSVAYFGVDGAGRVSILVSWATCDAILQSSTMSGNCTGPAKAGTVTRPLSTDGLVSRVYWGVDRGNATQLSNLAEGNATSYMYNYMNYTGINSASPVLHHVLIKGLRQGVRYSYAIVDSVASASQDGSRNRPLQPRQLGPRPFMGSFRTPGQAAPDGNPFPFNIAVLGDPGQTYNTSKTLTHIMHAWGLDPAKRRQWNRGGLDLVFFTGDYTYADEPQEPGTVPNGCNVDKGTYQPRWDTWQRLFQPLISAIPSMTLPGNHEVEWQPGTASYSAFQSMNAAYNARFPTPQRGAQVQPSVIPITDRESGYANSYWANKVPGVAIFITLTSYSPNDYDGSVPDYNGFNKSNQQYIWLEKQLKAINRTETPWLIVGFHSPFYNTYTAHYKENECMHQLYEPLLVKYSVDIVFNGHVHSYERSKPVSNYTVDSTGCAPMHVVIGDAGNVEGAAKEFITAGYADSRWNCNNPTARKFPSYQPQACLTYQSGVGSGCASNVQSCYCFNSQPAWSAYREPSFGHGRLHLLSSTTAVWQWMRNQGSQMKIADEVQIMRLPSCSA